MTLKTVDGEEIDVRSPLYQNYLRLKAIDEQHPNVSDPAPYRTLGDVLELERRKQDDMATNLSDTSRLTKDTLPAG